MARIRFSISYVALLTVISISEIFSTSFTVNNNCSHIVWPVVMSLGTRMELSLPDFAFQSGQSMTFSPPSGWNGRIWGRTLCNEDSKGFFSCVTGDCDSGTKVCHENDTTPTATRAEFSLDAINGLDFYDVTLVDGFNLPMLVLPQRGTGGNCRMTGCLVDLNTACPPELKMSSSRGGESVACKSACVAFGEPQYCCIGNYSSPGKCPPSSFSNFFKQACPRAYSYAFDDATSTFTCANASYHITFCPSTTTNVRAAELPPINGAMVFLGNQHTSGGSSSTAVAVKEGQVISFAVAILAANWRLWQLF